MTTDKSGIGDSLVVELNGDVVGAKGPDLDIWHEKGGLKADNTKAHDDAHQAFLDADEAVKDVTLVKGTNGLTPVVE